MTQKNIKIAPSLLSADFSCLGDEVKSVEDGGADYIHFDVMDGHFVPNITFGPPLIKSLRNYSSLIFDVHLMIEKPERYIEDFVKSGADIITVHVETCPHIHRTLQMIKDLGIKASVSLNPGTSPFFLDYIMDKLDMILVMSVNPGFGGQKFIPSVLKKVEWISSLIKESGLNIDIEVDGGIGPENVKEVVKSGSTVLVAGSSIFGKKPVSASIKSIRECL